MKHLINLFFLIPFALFSNLIAQTNQYPQGYFQNPVGHQMELTGSFGELRPNHFHSGIDIKAGKGMNNEPILAAAEGYVSRINVQGGGYGQSVFITHPNGYTTAYGHLDKFSIELHAILRKKQYETESFEQNIVFQPNEFPVVRGQEIGKMGNRGHSFGQHLHFEIRNTESGKSVNPLLFGFDVPDHVAPTIGGLKVYYLNEKREIIESRTVSLVKKNGGYGIVGDTLNVFATSVAFAVKTYDKQDGLSGDNGIFSLEMKENDALVYRFKAETVQFDENRYLNAHVDYYEMTARKSNYHRAFLLPGNHLSMYENVVNNGILQANQEGKKITLTSSDAAGNAVNLEFFVKSKGGVIDLKTKNYTYFIPVNEPSILKPNGANFYFPNNCFYENIYLKFGQNTEGGTYGIYSPTYQLQDNRTPIHAMFNVNIQPVGLPDSLKSKAFIAFCSQENGRVQSCGGAWSVDGTLMAKNNRFGNYCVMVDQAPPRISPVSIADVVYKSGRLAFRISDNFNEIGINEGLKYRAEIDGQWLMMEFDSKYDLLFLKLEEGLITEGVHQFKLTVTDDRGNESVYNRSFEYIAREPERRVAKAKSSKVKHSNTKRKRR